MTEMKFMGLETLLSLLQGTGGIGARSADLNRVVLRITLVLEVGTVLVDTYTYSVRDPWWHNERYIRAAPIDLRSPGQKYWTLRRVETEGTNRMATTACTRRRFRSKRSFNK